MYPIKYFPKIKVLSPCGKIRVSVYPLKDNSKGKESVKVIETNLIN